MFVECGHTNRLPLKCSTQLFILFSPRFFSSACFFLVWLKLVADRAKKRKLAEQNRYFPETHFPETSSIIYLFDLYFDRILVILLISSKKKHAQVHKIHKSKVQNIHIEKIPFSVCTVQVSNIRTHIFFDAFNFAFVCRQNSIIKRRKF